jgi:site-specific DNA recombinase
MAKRAILYARVSTHNQVDNTSLDYQIEQCRQYAGEHGFQVVREIREQQSGAHANREGLNIAKEMGKLGLADCMIVYKMDRFMRGDDAQSDPGIDAAITERELNRAGLDVIFLDLPPRESEAYAWIKAIKRIVASVERESIRTRFENGKSAALASGKPAHGGRCPLGYKRNDAGYFEIVETEASAIRLIYDLYLSGMNVPSIVDYLRRNNIPGYRNAKGTWGDWIVYEILATYHF